MTKGRALARALLVGSALVAVAWVGRPAQGTDAWRLVVLGIAQDAGIPQLGCNEGVCAAIHAGSRNPERVASVGLVNRQTGRAYLFDATPDFVSQVQTLTKGRTPDAIFLTHGHIGHYTGLMYLGREAIDAKAVPVYGTARMAAFLGANGPWSLLVSRRNIDVRTIQPGVAVDLGDGVRVTAYTVPHRDEFTDTVGYVIEGPHHRALFIPDIDGWEKWDRNVREVAGTVDYALVDGTFASPDEVPGRSLADIPHPMMSHTRDLLRGTRAALWFIHLNHTNREIDAKDVVKDGQQFVM